MVKIFGKVLGLNGSVRDSELTRMMSMMMTASRAQASRMNMIIQSGSFRMESLTEIPEATRLLGVVG